MPAQKITREDALDRITAVFRKWGYEGATLRMISEATGLGRASLYHHFPGGKDDMARAANRLRDVGGGVTMWRDGEELALIELPIAGLMTDEPAYQVAAKADRLIAAMQACGCTMNNAYMQHSLLALVVIPELRISDQGLIDSVKFEKTGLFV